MNGTITFKAAPRGQVCGAVMATRRDGSGVAVLVLPKVWRATDAKDHFHVDLRADLDGADTGTLQWYVVHELDTITFFDATDDRLVPWAELEAQAVAVFDDPTGRGEKQTATLLERVVSTQQRNKRSQRLGAASPDDVTEGLLRLLVLADRVGVGAPDFERDRLPVSAGRNPALAPLVRAWFVDEVARHIRRLRPGYRWLEEDLTTIRGRVLTESLPAAAASGWSTVRCRYEEFSADHDLTQVLIAALEVASARSGREAATRGLDATTRQRAVQIRRSLGVVPSPPRRQALQLAGRLRLSGPDRVWTRALFLAQAILAAEHVKPPATDNRSEVSATRLLFRMDVLWEKLLLGGLDQLTGTDGALQSSGAGSASADDLPFEAPAPFSGLGNPPRPDLYALEWAREGRPSRLWILDAKYKEFPGSAAPHLGDVHQIFVYSHLARLKVDNAPPWPQRLALLYPERSQEPMAELASYSYQRQPAGTSEVLLLVVGLPFPLPEDVMSEEGWDVYEQRLADGFREIMVSTPSTVGEAEDLVHFDA